MDLVDSIVSTIKKMISMQSRNHPQLPGKIQAQIDSFIKKQDSPLPPATLQSNQHNCPIHQALL